jgi:hypothetical protein
MLNKYMIKILLISVSISFSYYIYAKSPQTTPISNFKQEGLKNWQHKVFNGKTDYKIVKLDNKQVLFASSHGTASGLIKEQKIDLTKTPYLNWSWRIENRLGDLDEQSKSGDDYAARIYVVIDGGIFFWNTYALNFVWSSNSKTGKIWPNAYAGKHAMMIAVRSRQDPIKTWMTEKRNVAADLKTILGKDFHYIDGIAIMTDTDNSMETASTYFGEIYFSEN